MSFSFYCADSNYCDFLRKNDPFVPYTMEQKIKRPFIGIVFTLNGVNYYAPLTSPKQKHITMRNQLDFIKINNGTWGAINLNNMIPIHTDSLTPVDMNILSTDDSFTIAYKRLLTNQLSWCNKTENASFITQKAKKLYQVIVDKTAHPQLVQRCCNFPLDEQQYFIYCESNNLKITQNHRVAEHTESNQPTTNLAKAPINVGDASPFLPTTEAPAEQNKTAQQDNSLDHDPLSPSSQEDINTEGDNAKNTSSTLDQIKANAAEEIVENTDPILSTTKEPAVQPNHPEKISEQDEAARQGSSLAPDQPSQPSKDDVKIEKDNTKNTTSSLDKIETSAAEETAAPSNNLEKSNIQKQIEVDPCEVDRKGISPAPDQPSQPSKDDLKTEKDNTKKPMSMLDGIKARGEAYQKENQQQPKTKGNKVEQEER